MRIEFKDISKLPFHIVVFLLSITIMILAFFKLFNANNDLTFTLLPDINYPLLIMGAILFLYSIAVFIISNNHLNAIPKKINPDELEAKFLKLSKTQTDILRILYRSHSNEISVNDFYTQFSAKNPSEIVGSSSEMLFRVRDLAVHNFIELKKIQEKVTMIILVTEVGTILEERKLLWT